MEANVWRYSILSAATLLSAGCSPNTGAADAAGDFSTIPDLTPPTDLTVGHCLASTPAHVLTEGWCPTDNPALSSFTYCYLDFGTVGF